MSSIRSRGESDGWISVDVYAEVADLPPGTIEAWRSRGRLPTETIDNLGQKCYPASELIRAMII